MPGVREELSSALVAGDETVKAAGANAGSPRMGTTLTMALVLWPLLYVAHVGDTRCYLLHGHKLQRLTTDHNLAEKLAGADGQLETAEHLQNILWNSLGGSNEIPQPELAKVELEAGDTLLLCSDGLNKHLTDERIQSVLEEPESSAVRAAKLVQMANAEGGTDNVTAIVAQVHQLTRGS
jgi:protein phosphatase